MTGPGDEIAAGAGGRGHLRASHADRDQVIGMLKAAFVQGRLTKDELDMRVGQTLASRTYADLAALTADLPAGLARTQPVRKPARAKARPTARVAVILCPAGIYASVGVAHAVLIGNERLLIALMPVFISFVVWMVAGVVNWRDKRSGGQSPRRPAPGASGQGSRRLPSTTWAGSFRQPIPVTIKPPKLHRSVAPATTPCCPAGGHRPPRDTSHIRHSAALHQLLTPAVKDL